MTRRRLLMELDSTELTEWIAFEKIEPAANPYWCAALITSTIAQVHGAKVKLADFLPRPSYEDGTATLRDQVAEQKARAVALFAGIAAKFQQPGG